MTEQSVVAALPSDSGVRRGDVGASSAGCKTGRFPDGGASPSQRISNLVRRAMMFLESDRQGARRCLNDALALLGPPTQEGRAAHDPVAHGVYQAGGLARWQARRAVTYIDTHLGSGLDVRTLAGLVSYSKSHFSRAFKHSLGLPPLTYIRMRRIERAKELMTSTTQQLTEIALICGFADQSHLNRTFRGIIGLSPGRWRRSNVQTLGESSRPLAASAALHASGIEALVVRRSHGERVHAAAGHCGVGI
jgi:AraC family transcriptional regulator